LGRRGGYDRCFTQIAAGLKQLVILIRVMFGNQDANVTGGGSGSRRNGCRIGSLHDLSRLQKPSAAARCTPPIFTGTATAAVAQACSPFGASMVLPNIATEPADTLRNSADRAGGVSTHIDRLEAAVARDRARVLDWSDKAVQPAWYGRCITEVAEARTRLDELSTPMMTLDRRAIDENLSTMSRWCAQAGLSHAPHGKTTMAPALWRDQLLAGCWAITVANEPQLRVARGVGVPRVILANVFLRPGVLAWLAAELAANPGFEFFCWVDSVQAVQIMDEALRAAGAQRRVHVLIEVGHAGARTGVRSLGGALEVAAAVTSAAGLALAGVAGFEGSLAHKSDAKAIADVDRFLTTMVKLHQRLIGHYEVPEAVLSAGGSAFFDRVGAVLGPYGGPRGPVHTRVVLRSGAYLVHDDGYYRTATPHTRGCGPALRSAMHVWARVISMPEPAVAYLDAGKRDLPFDEGLPELQLIRRTGTDGATTTRPLVGHELFAINDQHCHVRVPAGSPLRVGDVVRLGLSHPCTAFDKWSLIPILDDASAQSPVVIDLVRTYF